MSIWFFANLTPYAPRCADLPINAPWRNIKGLYPSLEAGLEQLLMRIGRAPGEVALRVARLGDVAVMLNIEGQAKVPLAFIAEPGEAECRAALEKLAAGGGPDPELI